MKKLLCALLLAALVALLTTGASAGFLSQVGDALFAPTPSPTPRPRTSWNFDYDALVSDPESYKDHGYVLVGSIDRITPMDLNILDWTAPAAGMLMVDDELAKLSFVVFDNPEGRIEADDTVHAVATFYGTTQVQTAFGFYATLPAFIVHSMEPIE